VFAMRYRDTDLAGRARRSEIQERMLAASDQRCNDFKTLLQKKFSNVSFNTGVASAALSVAATIVTPLNTSKALSGLAGISSAYRAEYNQAYFANAAVQVVVAGIDSRRRTAYEQILHARNEPLGTYPLEAAVKDAIRYHGLCSTVSGLQEAGEAVRYYNEPGITAATRTIARSRMLMDIQNASGEQVIERLKRWQEVIPSERYLAGNPLGEQATSRTFGGTYLIEHLAHALTEFKMQGGAVGKALNDLAPKTALPEEITKAQGIASEVESRVSAACHPVIEKQALKLARLQAELLATPEANAEPLQLQLKQARQSAELVKASVDFLSAGFATRATDILLAVRDQQKENSAASTATAKAALARWNAFAPTFGEGCEVKSF